MKQVLCDLKDMNIDQVQKLLLVIAHPDDEVFVSGTICFFRELGYDVQIVCVTEGGKIPGDAEAVVRKKELIKSTAALGVERVRHLSRPDIHPHEWFTRGPWDLQGLSRDIGQIIIDWQPTIILTHGPKGGYGHPAHCATFEATISAAVECAYKGWVYSFCGQVEGAFFSWWFDEPADVEITVTKYTHRRAQSLSAHESQMSVFLQPSRLSCRGIASSLFAYLFFFLKVGRKRIPINNPLRFMKLFPVEGLVLKRLPDTKESACFFERLRATDIIKINTRRSSWNPIACEWREASQPRALSIHPAPCHPAVDPKAQ